MSGILPLERLIDELKQLARAPREEFLARIHSIEEIQRITVTEAGEAAFLLCSALRLIARQIVFVDPQSEEDMRGIILASSVVLQNELNRADARRRPRRYYTDAA